MTAHRMQGTVDFCSNTTGDFGCPNAVAFAPYRRLLYATVPLPINKPKYGLQFGLRKRFFLLDPNRIRAISHRQHRIKVP